MDPLNIGVFTALIAGIISFASPCVLPIVPGYLSFITGLGLQDLTDHERRKSVLRQATINSIVFVIGFSVIFILLGASATAVGGFMREHLGVLGKIAGVIIVVLGLHMVGLVRIPFLMYERRLSTSSRPQGLGRSLSAGVFFAFGWTPCIGPILAGILAIAAAQETTLRGVLLLAVYSLGLGIPFILSAVFLNRFFAAFSRIKHHLHKVEVTGGVILLAIGILIFTGNLAAISQKLDFMNPEYLLQENRNGTSLDAVLSDTAVTSIAGAVKADYGKYDFHLKTLDGETIRLSDHAGKVVLVNIWAPWCGPCRMEAPGFVKLYQQYRNRGFEVIGVAVETNEEAVREFIKTYNIEWPVGVGDDVARAYGTYGLPDNLLFAPDGKLIKHFVGFTQEAALGPYIQKALAHN